jgi:outer membrane immunogenic protein
MKIKLFVAVAATVVASSAMAQSAFQGFYGQIATGYENNSVSSLGMTGTQAGQSVPDSWNASNQSFGGAPLVIGAGYNFSLAPKWLIGLGVDYSALSQKSSTYSYTIPDGSSNGASVEVSNRFNVFVAPGYAIDKDKLVYLKAGYSSVSAKGNSATSFAPTTGSSIPWGQTSQTKTLSGYVLGLGYKQMITGGFYGVAEFNYMSYSKASFSGTDSEGYTLSSNPSLNSYQALIGIGYKF